MNPDVITGKGYTPRQVRLRGWRHVALAGALLFLFLTIVLPFLVMLYVSLINYMRQPSWEAIQSFSLQHYETVINQPRARKVFWNTIYMTILTATAVTTLSFVIAYIVVRTRFAARYVLDMLAFLPHSIHGIVLGLALFWLLLQFDILTGASTFGSLYALVFGFTSWAWALGFAAASVFVGQLLFVWYWHRFMMDIASRAERDADRLPDVGLDRERE